MTTEITIRKNNRNPDVAAILSDSAGVINVTGLTVKFYMRSVTGSTNKINGAACTVVDGAAGSVSYSWGATDTDTAGEFVGYFEITDGLGETESVPNDSFILVHIVDSLYIAP